MHSDGSTSRARVGIQYCEKSFSYTHPRSLSSLPRGNHTLPYPQFHVCSSRDLHIQRFVCTSINTYCISCVCVSTFCTSASRLNTLVYILPFFTLHFSALGLQYSGKSLLTLFFNVYIVLY